MSNSGNDDSSAPAAVEVTSSLQKLPSSSSSSQEQQQTDPRRNSQQQQQHPDRPVSKYHGLTPEEFWKVKKKERKDRIKERNKEQKEEKQRQWKALSPEEQEQKRQAALVKHEQRQKEQLEMETRSKANLSNPDTPSIVFDLQFSSAMVIRDVKSTVNQLKISYSAMRKEGFVLKPVFFEGAPEKKKREQNDGDGDGVDDDADDDADHDVFNQLKGFEGFNKFPPRFVAGASVASMDREKTVYLTADSPDVLLDFKPGENYVIGAFVDHNRMKGATVNFAKAAGMRTARLPLDEMITVGNRCKVLTINHVVDVMLAFAKHRDWKRAFLDHLPVRRVVEEEEEEAKDKGKKAAAASADGNTTSNDDSDDDSSAPQRRQRD